MTIRRIVVGIDDSGPARHALRWALEEATLLGRELDVVHVYPLPVVLVPPPVPSPAAMGPDIKSLAEALVHRLTAEALGDQQIQRLLASQYDRARQILLDHREALEAVAAALIEHETLSGDAVIEIVGQCRAAPPTALRAAG